MEAILGLVSLSIVAIVAYIFFMKTVNKRKLKEKLKNDYDNAVAKLKSYQQIILDAKTMSIAEGAQLDEIITQYGVNVEEKPISQYGFNTFISKVSIVNEQVENLGLLDTIKKKVNLLKEINSALSRLPSHVHVQSKYTEETVQHTKLIESTPVITKLFSDYSKAIDDYKKLYNITSESFAAKDFDKMTTDFKALTRSFEVVVGFSNQLKGEIKREELKVIDAKRRETVKNRPVVHSSRQRETEAQRLLRQDRFDKERRRVSNIFEEEANYDDGPDLLDVVIAAEIIDNITQPEIFIEEPDTDFFDDGDDDDF